MIPGAGQTYAARWRRGLALYLGDVALVTLGAAALVALPLGPWGVALLALSFLAYRLWVAGDAFRLTRAAARPASGRARWLRRASVAAFVAGVAAFGEIYAGLLRRNLSHAYRIPTGSMEPTLLVGDYVFAIPADARSVRRGGPIVYRWPEDTTKNFIHRLVGLPGDTLAMRGGVLYVNGTAAREPFAHHTEPTVDPAVEEFGWQRDFLATPTNAYRASRNNWGPLVVPAEQYFVLGDNRDNSYDSRYWGFLKATHITGRPRRVYFSRESGGGRVRWERIGRGVA